MQHQPRENRHDLFLQHLRSNVNLHLSIYYKKIMLHEARYAAWANGPITCYRFQTCATTTVLPVYRIDVFIYFLNIGNYFKLWSISKCISKCISKLDLAFISLVVHAWYELCVDYYRVRDAGWLCSKSQIRKHGTVWL